MPYCTQTDIVNLELTLSELITLTDDSKAGTVDADKVTAAIAKADAEIDGLCQDGYVVPFNPVPGIVVTWSATLAAFNLYRNRPKPATLIDRYNKVMSWLSDVSQGKKTIPGASANSNTNFPGSTTDGTAPVFQKQHQDANGNIVTTGTMEVW